MNEHREHDDGSVTHEVRRFRRLARRAAADPLRLLPPDPLTLLASLGAPVAALIAVAPIDRLRAAVAAPAMGARGDSPRTRWQPVVRNASPTRPAATSTLAGRASRPSTARDAGMVTARHAAPLSQRGDAAAREAKAQRAAPPTTTIAQRRAALRRTLSATVTPPESSPPALAQVSATMHPRSAADTPAATASVTGATPDWVRHLLASLPGPAGVIPHDDPIGAASSAPAGSLDAKGSHHAADGTWLGDDAAIAPAGGAGFEADALARSPEPRAGMPPLAASSHPIGRPESRSDAEAMRRRRTWEHVAGSELAEDMFEALYRDGVDLSWP